MPLKDNLSARFGKHGLRHLTVLFNGFSCVTGIASGQGVAADEKNLYFS